jgi:cobaltochelatase CobS
LVKVHPKFRCALAANTFGFGATAKFIGRNPLDQASLDRFTYIPCHYDENLERLLYGDNPWTTYVHRVRAAVNQLELQHVVSMRAISRGRKFLDNGADPERVCRLALWRNLAPDTVARIENIAGRFTTKLREVA